MKKGFTIMNLRKATLTMSLAFTSLLAVAQTNVYDDVIATSANHTSLKAAIDQQMLQGALQDPSATLTVFAPDNDAFDNLATALNTDIAGLLALPNLTEVLLYHVLGITVDAASVTNGAIVDPLNVANTIKMTKTSTGFVYANQAMVNGADLSTDNGIVHSVDAVLLPFETVVDVAIDNGFTYLTTAVIQEELLPALTDPLASLTVFAPTDVAFDNLATALNTDIAGLLALPNLTDILLYHVVAGTVLSGDLANGPVPTLNGLDIYVDLTMGTMINTSNVTGADNTADNGVVHIIDAVLVPGTADIEEAGVTMINVSPNPATQQLKINNFDVNDYTVMNAYGQTVLKGSTENGTVNVSELKNGNYFINITNETGIFRARFIKL
jgi:transforming growth factor-beta-induced protein|tara:strand:- start:26 stop:1174 length:1149 start_codon:yes stop_codon:yes gene_type:complete